MIYSSVIFIPSLVMLSMGFNNQQASLMLLLISASNAIAAHLIGKILYSAGSLKYSIWKHLFIVSSLKLKSNDCKQQLMPDPVYLTGLPLYI